MNLHEWKKVTITTQTVSRLKNRLHIGDRISFIAVLLYDKDTGLPMRGQYKKITRQVIKKYPHLVQVEDSGSRIITVPYRDILTVKKGIRR